MNKSKVNILVADDDEDGIQMLTEVLSEIIPVFVLNKAKNGIEFLSTLKTIDKPDLVFLDLNMPLKNGIACLGDISNSILLPDTPVIVYSTSRNSEEIDIAYKFGARFYLVKPCSYTTLLRLLKIVFNKLGEPLRQQLQKANFLVSEKLLSNVDTFKLASVGLRSRGNK